MDLLKDQEVDALGRLEERIQQAAELVARLQRDNEAALAESKAAIREAAEAKASAARLTLELEALKGERGQIRSRIERLIGQMDLLGAG